MSAPSELILLEPETELLEPETEEGYGLFYLARKTLLATKQARVPRYVLGHGSWEAVLRGSGELPYEVKWTGMVLCVDGPTDTVFFAVATVCMVPRIAIGGAL
ncbi:hypothetical protein AK812_SmicGene40080 [Symbiodinium microadriaticum]|uniref:Uncharacterized protein n=1 Tax=Symbiodinium microadriaticum TaxID=2951 RepID=A0A1Q9C9L2_SYMMI|nr:hypothetical protein AK812_SmicGene40080 [Symbiodinium microadriaticum]